MTTIDEPSRRTLDEVPGRILAFTIGVSTSLPIRAALATKGYSQKEHDEAWGILAKLSTFVPEVIATFDQKVQAAIAELDRWDEPNFACISAALERGFPEQEAFIFQKNLTASQGPTAVVGVATLLGRIASLSTGKDRPRGSHKADLAAVELLAKRGYTTEELARLESLVTVAQSLTIVAPISADDRSVVLLQGLKWINDWSASARTVISRRDYLIRLGLAKRKKPQRAAAAPAPNPPPLAAPQLPPPGTTPAAAGSPPAEGVTATALRKD